MSDSTQAPARLFDCGGRLIDLSIPRVMGVLNVTPDSFSDGGSYYANLDRALRHAVEMVEAGADFIDIGGESTRPGAAEVSTEEELSRVLPMVEAVARELDCVISVDTSKARVMRESACVGAGLLNDVRAFREQGALTAASESGLPVCLMHMQGQPETMQQAPAYSQVLDDVSEFLRERIQACGAAGIPRERIIIDPGFGFGKTAEHNLALLNRLSALDVLGCPVLAGLSRKSLLGRITGREVEQRKAASVAAATLAVYNGARIIRAHDVAETVDAVKVAWATISETTND